MHYGISVGGELGSQVLIDDRALDEVHVDSGEVGHRPSAQVVEHNDAFGPGIDETPTQVRANEPCPACHQYPHPRTLPPWLGGTVRLMGRRWQRLRRPD